MFILYLEPGVFSERRTEKLPLRVDFIHRVEFGECMKCSFGISDFLEELSSLSHSIVFLYFFAQTTEEGFLISPCYSLELCIQMSISFLFYFAFRFSSFHSYQQHINRTFSFTVINMELHYQLEDYPAFG